MTPRQTYSIDDIKTMLIARIDELAYRYAPPVQGSYEDKGIYFTLNPGRVDRSVGSFYVHLRGPKAGKWRDHATGQFGDVLDLIALALNTDGKGALREARLILGLQHESHDDRRRREKALAEAKARRAAAELEAREEAERTRKAAVRLWLSGSERISGTPVERYLSDARGIDLQALGRQPRALRYVPSCWYSHTDRKTGEVIEGRFPAMAAIMVDRAGKPVAVHRTWLAIGRDGSWSKAPVPKPKKVLGECGGAYIPIWKGLGPRGGKAVPLSQCPPGSHVYIAEGIEDALSGAMLLPEARFLAAYSLGNMGCVPLPATVSTVTLIADQDAAPEAQHALSQAIQAHRSAGRTVRVWRNQWGGKDLNDALRAAAPERGAHELEPASGWGGHAMTFFLDPSDAAADQPPVVPEEARASTASPAGFGEVFNASRNAQKIRSDAWFYEYGLRRELAQPMWDRLDREARNRVLMRIEGPDGYWRSWDDYVREEARAAAADFPEAWSDLSLDDEPFEAEIARRRKAELDEAQAVLDRPGGGLAEFLGVGATAMTDEINLATLPFAFGGGALRVIGSEALLNGVAERCLADAVARNVLSAASSSRTRRRSSCKGTLIRMPPERLVFWPRYSTRSPLMFQGPRFTAPSHAPRRVAHPRAIQAVPRENSRSAASPLA